MKSTVNIAALVIGLQLYVLAQAPRDPESLKRLYDAHRVFELGEALESTSAPPPPLYAGAVAAAFDRVADAETHLTRAIRDALTIEAANEAREWLINLYLRLGRSSDAVRVIDDALKTAPSRSDMRNAHRIFSSITRYRDQTVQTRRRQSFSCTVSPRGLVIPLSVNGKAVNWFLDTAFSLSALSESEARMLGLSVQVGGQAEDLAGGTAPARTAVAERVTVAGNELRNVPLLVFPDSQPPWNDLPAGRRGAIGLPVAVAQAAAGTG